MNDHCHCCLLMLWARAIRGILANRQAIEDVLVQRERQPSKASDKDFFRECAWAIYNARTRYKAVKEIWPDVEEAFLCWDYALVCQSIDKVRTAATRIRIWNSVRKAEATTAIALWMHKTGWAAIKQRLLSGLKTDSQGNLKPEDGLIAYLDQLRMIGETNATFILKNLGYDVAKADIRLRRLAARFDYPGDKDGVQQFASDISKLALERISVVETVLWNACNSKADLGFKCPACGRQR